MTDNDKMLELQRAVNTLNGWIAQLSEAGWRVRVAARPGTRHPLDENLGDNGVAIEISRRFGVS